MSTFDYDELVADVISIIEEFGTVFDRRVQLSFDQVSMSMENNQIIDQVRGVVISQNVKINDSYVKQNVLYIEPSKPISKSDEIMVNNVWYTMKEMKETRPANTTLLYQATMND